MLAIDRNYAKYIHNRVIYTSKGNVVVVNMDASKKHKVTTSTSEFKRQITLQDIPESEKWLWQNPEALASVKKGLKQSAEGKGRFIGSFAEYADLEIDE